MFSSVYQGRKRCQKPSLRIPGPSSLLLTVGCSRRVTSLGKLTLSLSKLSKILCLFLLRKGNTPAVTHHCSIFTDGEGSACGRFHTATLVSHLWTLASHHHVHLWSQTGHCASSNKAILHWKVAWILIVFPLLDGEFACFNLFYSSIVDFQCSVTFCCIAKWHGFCYGLSQNIEHSSLCSAVEPCCLSILRVNAKLPIHPSLTPSPLATTSLFSVSESLSLSIDKLVCVTL